MKRYDMGFNSIYGDYIEENVTGDYILYDDCVTNVAEVKSMLEDAEARVLRLQEQITELKSKIPITSGSAEIPDVGKPPWDVKCPIKGLCKDIGCITRCEKCGNWLELCKCKTEKKWNENKPNLQKSVARRRAV